MKYNSFTLLSFSHERLNTDAVRKPMTYSTSGGACITTIFIKSIAVLVLSIGSSLTTMHCGLLLLSVHCCYSPLSIPQLQLLILPLLQPLLLMHLSQSYNELFQFSSLPYKSKLARYFHATLHKVSGVMVVPRNAAMCNSTSSYEHNDDIRCGRWPTVIPSLTTATVYLSSGLYSSLIHCKCSPTVGVHIF